MEKDSLKELFREIRETKSKRTVIEYVNKQAFKLSRNPSEYLKYLNKINKLFMLNPAMRIALTSESNRIGEESKKEINTNRIFEIFAEIPREKTKERKMFIQVFAEYASGLISQDYWKRFSLKFFSSLQISTKNFPLEIDEIIKTIEGRRVPFFIAFSEKKLSNFLFSDITYQFPASFSFFVVISTFVDDETVLEKILNTTFLYSFKLIPKEIYKLCLSTLNKDVLEFFELYLDNEEPHLLHPSELRKHIKYILIEKYDSVFQKKILDYITNESDEATVTNTERLVNLSRFIAKQKNTFWQDFYLFDENANSRYQHYIKAARFSRMQSEDELSDLNEASFAVFGKDYDLSTRVDEPCVTKAIVKTLHNEASFMNKQCISALKQELENTDYKSPNYRFLYKYLISKKLVERTITLDGFDGDEIDPEALRDGHILAQFKHFKFFQSKKITNLLFELSSNEVVFSREGALIVYYLSKLINIVSKITPQENGMNISEVIMNQTPPFNQFSGELCCIDMVLIKLAKSIDKLTKTSKMKILQNQMKENEADFLFSFRKKEGKFKVTPIINPFVTFQSDDDDD